MCAREIDRETDTGRESVCVREKDIYTYIYTYIYIYIYIYRERERDKQRVCAR